MIFLLWISKKVNRITKPIIQRNFQKLIILNVRLVIFLDRETGSKMVGVQGYEPSFVKHEIRILDDPEL